MLVCNGLALGKIDLLLKVGCKEECVLKMSGKKQPDQWKLQERS